MCPNIDYAHHAMCILLLRRVSFRTPENSKKSTHKRLKRASIPWEQPIVIVHTTPLSPQKPLTPSPSLSLCFSAPRHSVTFLDFSQVGQMLLIAGNLSSLSLSLLHSLGECWNIYTFSRQPADAAQLFCGGVPNFLFLQLVT